MRRPAGLTGGPSTEPAGEDAASGAFADGAWGEGGTTGPDPDQLRPATPPGRFIGFAADHYRFLSKLTWPVADVRRVFDLLGDTYAGDLLIDPDEAAVNGHLKELADADHSGGWVIAMWAGHGQASPNGGVRLLVADSTARKSSAGRSPQDVLAACVDSGANQILLIVDTCYAGAAVDALTAAAALLEAVPPSGDTGPWIGVLAACSPFVTAGDGVFAEHLCRVLKSGAARKSKYSRDWSSHNQLISGQTICHTICEEWPSTVHPEPRYGARGLSAGMFRNPRWEEAAPAVVVEHLLLAARGGSQSQERSWFTGRTAEVDRVVSWVTSRVPGVWVVTGPAGTGKSAIVGRVVSASLPPERARLLAEDHDLGHDDPGQRSVQAHVHARGVTVNRLAEQLDHDLVRAGVVDRAKGGPRNANELLGAVERSSQYAGAAWWAPVVVVDGVDEAREQAFPIATELLVRLARWCTLIVSTRNLPPLCDTGNDLLQTLAAPDHQLDLNDSEVAARGRDAIQDYVTARLVGVSAAMDQAAVAKHFLASINPVAGQPFLIARLMTAQLRTAPIDTTVPGWKTQISTSLRQAFLADLATVRAPAHRPDVADPAILARELLAALAWGYGLGLPEAEWITVANATSTIGFTLDREDITWVLGELGRFVVEDGEGGVAVYRASHQSLAEHLHRAFRATAQAPFDAGALPVAEALLGRYMELLRAERPAKEPRYLWRYAWRHAAGAGVDGLGIFRDISARTTDLRYDMALAAQQVSGVLAFYGRLTDAVAPAVEAATIYKDLAKWDPAVRPDLAGALNLLGVRYSSVGQRPAALECAEEAVRLRRPQSADNPAYLPDLAAALNNLGNRYLEVGRRSDAVDRMQQAVRLYRELTAGNPAYLPDLAAVLTNLGVLYGEIARPLDAIGPTEEAVNRYQKLAADNLAFRPGLAVALTNLGALGSDVGRPRDAVSRTEEAVRLYRKLAKNPAYARYLAGALNNLGAVYGEAGRTPDAVATTEEAVRLYRGLADNPAHKRSLAMALRNLGRWYGETEREHEAIALTEEAARLYRWLAAENPTILPDVSGTLSNLVTFYRAARRLGDALASAEEAVTVYRQMVAREVVFLPDLAWALTNLGSLRAEAGHPRDALAPTVEAVRLRRLQAADNPVYLPDLAAALANLGVFYAQVGRARAALTPAQEAVVGYRELAAGDLAIRPRLAFALTNLGNLFSEAKRPLKALAPAEEAVRLYRDLTADDPAHLPFLGMALSGLGDLYSGAKQPQKALVPVKEAVQLYRDLSANDPAFLPDLAAALNNYGERLSQAGRGGAALSRTKEAVDLYREIVPINPAYPADLDAALASLEARMSESGEDPTLFDTFWTCALRDLRGEARAYLRYRRAAAAPAGDARAVTWLVTALNETGDEGSLTAAVHEQARRHREHDPVRFDALWTRPTGDTLPYWLLVESVLLAAAHSWVNIGAYEAEVERDWVAAHPELLDANADIAVDEALLTLSEEEASRYRTVRAAARANGVHVTYQLLQQLLAERAAANPEAFWATQAHRLSWSTPFVQVLNWTNAPHATWFADGKLNIAYNCVDRHVTAGHGDTVAIHWEGEPGDSRTITYRQLLAEVSKAANALNSLGLKAGDRVVIYLPMIPEAVFAMLACARLGLAHSVVSTVFSSEVLRYRIGDTKARLVITADGQYRRGSAATLKAAVDEAVSGADSPVENVLVVRRTGIDVTWRNKDLWWNELVDCQSDQHTPEAFPAEQPLFILYTPGHQGKPEGILHTSGGYLTQAAYTHRVVFDHKPDTDVYWCTADIGLVTGHSYIVYGPLANRATEVLYEGTPNTPHRARHWEIIDKYKVSIYYATPPLIQTFLKLGDDLPSEYDLSSLRVLGSVRESIYLHAGRWYPQFIGHNTCPIVETWCQTQTGAIMLDRPPSPTTAQPDFPMTPLAGISAIVIDAKGISVGVGDAGNLMFDKPWPAMLRAIWGDENYFDRYRAWFPIRDHYFTQEGAKYDTDGALRLLGRVGAAAAVINVSGHRLHLDEVESALIGHPAVEDVAVVGAADDMTGERPVAFVTLKPVHRLASDSRDAMVIELRNQATHSIGPIARPKWVIVLPELPRTSTGKFHGRVLWDIAQNLSGDALTLSGALGEDDGVIVGADVL